MQIKTVYGKNELDEKGRYYSIDVFKFVMAIVVIAIHVNPFEHCANPYVQNIWGGCQALAVPYFFVASGFLMASKTEQFHYKSIPLLKKVIYKLAKMYVVWTIIYFPLTIYGYAIQGYTFIHCVCDFVKGFFLIGEHYNSWPLWYLLSAIYGYFVLYICVKKKWNRKTILLIGLVALIFGGLWDTFVAHEFVNSGVILIQKIVIVTIGGGRIFRGTGFIIFGYFMKEFRLKDFSCSIMMALGTAMCVFGYAYVYKTLVNIGALVAVIGFFHITLQIRFKKGRYCCFLGRLSQNMYFIHMYVYSGICLLIFGTMARGLRLFFIVTLMTIAISVTYEIVHKYRLTAEHS